MSVALRPAERVLHSLGVTEPEDIDIEAIAWHLGAQVRYRPLKTCEARILGRDDKAIICVDSGKSVERQRFSICHELGHWHHHRGRCLACRSEDIGNRSRGITDLERVADSYAADLLLPRYLVTALGNQVSKWSLERLRGVASAFRASVTATAIRLVELDLVPGMVVCHGQRGRRWFTRAPSVPSRWFPQEQLDPDSQALAMLYGREPELRHPSLIGADAWFDVSGADRHELHEQTYAVPGGEIVTLLLMPSKMLG